MLLTKGLTHRLWRQSRSVISPLCSIGKCWHLSRGRDVLLSKRWEIFKEFSWFFFELQTSYYYFILRIFNFLTTPIPHGLEWVRVPNTRRVSIEASLEQHRATLSVRVRQDSRLRSGANCSRSWQLISLAAVDAIWSWRLFWELINHSAQLR